MLLIKHGKLKRKGVIYIGLDMYLRKRTYIGNKYKKPEDQVKIDIPNIKQERVSEITESVAYWRKANAIHAWFVDNVQNGEDDCKEYSVERSQLQELLDTVSKVVEASELVEGKVVESYTIKDGQRVPNLIDGKIIKDSKVAEELLPTVGGFFFGSTDYDEYYYNDLVETKKQLEEVLAEDSNIADFVYQASW